MIIIGDVAKINVLSCSNGAINTTQLKTQEAHVNLSGIGNIQVNVEEPHADLNGTGNIKADIYASVDWKHTGCGHITVVGMSKPYDIVSHGSGKITRSTPRPTAPLR